MTYLFSCDPCGHQFEERRAVDDRDEPAACPECKGAARRVFAAGVQVKTPFWWADWSREDVMPDTDTRPDLARKCWPTSGTAREKQMRGRF